MAYDVRLIKLVSNELVIGKYDAAADVLNDVAIMQTIPAQQGVQLMILPYGYPFEQDFISSFESKHFMYQYKNVPQDVQDKYLEAVSTLSLSSGGLNPKGAAGVSGKGLIL